MKVFVSDHNSERYMLGESETIEEARKCDLEGKKRVDAAIEAHERWYEEAKAADPKTKNDEAILGLARRHLEAARRLAPPVQDGSSVYDSRWSAWADAYYRETFQFETCRDAIHFAQIKIPFDHRETISDHRSELHIYEKLVSEEFIFRFDTQMKLYDNPRSVPETLYLTMDRLVSNVFYWHTRIMFRCQTDISPLNSILEIGGGYGALARLWMINETARIDRYVIADLPESLFFSEVCLRDEFGDQVGYWEGTDPGTRIVLIPVARLKEYHKKSDLVINVGSMQEMSDTWVGHYMDWLDVYKPKYFYSLNYGGSPLAAMFESRNFWAPRLSNKWSMRCLNPDVPLVKMMCSGRDFVEAIYEYSRATRKFSEWSVLKGAFVNRITYLEGLELLRQEFTIPNARQFLVSISAAHDASRIPLPKEFLFVASLVLKHTNDPEIKKVVDTLLEARKMGIY